jgi:hypothetical protein
MRPALYTLLTGVAILAFVGILLISSSSTEPLSVCGGISATTPDGMVKCAPLPASLPAGMTPLPYHAIDYR